MKLNTSRLQRATPTVLASFARYLILICFSYVLVYPFLFMGVKSVMPPLDFDDPTVNWVAKSFTSDNFVASYLFLDYGKTFLNTVLNSIIPALLSFFTCAVAGYGLARFDFKGKKILTVIMLLCIMVPEQLIMIPSYKNLKYLDFMGILGLVFKITGIDFRVSVLDTPLSFILPALLATGLKNGLFIYIYTQFFKGLPKELEEAAWIDGAGPWKTFLRIVLPSSGSSTVTVLVFSIVWYWNEYFLTSFYVPDNPTFAVRLYKLNQSLTLASSLPKDLVFSNGALRLTCCLVSIVPLLIFFLFMQRKFLRSIATCGIVG